MVGRQDPQCSLYACDAQFLKMVGEDTFYGFLARNRHTLFCDDDFANLYTPDNGRNSVPPSLLAVALLLQSRDRVGDEEAAQRAQFDIRWKVALGIEIDEKPFAKSTLQLFRARLLLHKKEMTVFTRSVQAAKQSGLMKSRKLKVALDTTPIFGKGAVKDTYNLLADGICRLVRVLGQLDGLPAEKWAQEHDLSRYFGTSIKGEAEIDWDDPEARQALLNSIVADSERLLVLAGKALARYRPDSCEAGRIQDAARLLSQLLAQDVERDKEGKAALKQGVARDRIVSTTDPEMRHGRKSKSRRFDGHKGAIAVDTDSQIITAVDVIAGSAPDNEDALELVKETEENTGCEVEKAIGDCAYGDGATRRKFHEHGIKLVAKQPRAARNGQLPKRDFKIDLEAGSVTCPAGQTTTCWKWTSIRVGPDKKKQKTKRFLFDSRVCQVCPHYKQCVKSKKGKGRTVTLHPEEALLQQAQAYQETEAFKEDNRRRQVVEHRLARLIQLGVRKSRFFGRGKTLFQLLMAAAVANLMLVAVWQLSHGFQPGFGAVSMGFFLLLLWLLGVGPAATRGEHRTRTLPHLLQRTNPSARRAFRPDF